MKLTNLLKLKSTFVPGIILPSLIFILGITFLSSFFPVRANYYLNILKTFLFENMNWLYVMVVTIFVLFLLFLIFSKYGSIRLGANDTKPEFSFFSWISMLFAAGMGIGLMYFSVAEPMSHYTDPSVAGLTSAARAKDAQLYTFFHWGIHAWAIYGVVGLSLAYFTYRYKLPLSLRSCFYPILKDKIQGRAGDIVDMFALCSTFFGITTTLGFGVVQLTAGLVHLGIIPESNFMYQVIIVIVIMTIAILSATSGVTKGVKILSQINIIAALVLILFVLILGPTTFLLGTFSEGLGEYINAFFHLTFNTHAHEPERQQWFFNWTILYWAWWISWSPYVGLFIAKISKGRTIREFISAVLIIPSVFNFMWMTIFGNSAIWMDQHQANGALSAIVANTDVLLFKFFEFFPLQQITNILSIFIIFIFFVTSADSGIYVMNSISSNNAAKSPKWQYIFWGVLLAILALVLLNAGGLKSLQTMTLITALPFSIIMLLFCYCLMKALTIDTEYHAREFSHSTNNWSGEYWKERLGRILSYKDRNTIDAYLKNTVFPAFQELAEEFGSKGIIATVNLKSESPSSVEIEIKHDAMTDFRYGVKSQLEKISDFLREEENAPDIGTMKTHVPMTYFGDEREGYDIQYFTKNEIISDVLKQYERFLSLSSDEKNAIFIGSNLKDQG
ncbi:MULTISPECIES: BCCT family transporter [Sphingobacterium]|uniref:BCCT family transporter n=1 Tax=Sphingobacterium TaxID=28453 RepID=UPI00104CD3BD|nr:MULTISPECIES: BCCT family transporter [Sphingobacterium]MCW2259241.1 choline/glycine/proline betaine transport protein [Sphingobacterium kitahiroshimense]TCR14310.1 choline/glycine/proline betaine transport protein [Sphingobacterium sp. JUb78]